MYTKNQVLSIGKNFIIPLFYLGFEKCDIDDTDGLTSGFCFYYATRLAEFLQGRWRNVNVNSLTEEQKQERFNEIGKVCSFDESHYFVEYDGNYFDGNGPMRHTDTTVSLWEYEDNTYCSNTDKRTLPKSKLYYQGFGIYDSYASLTMNYYKDAVFDIYDTIIAPFKDEFMTKLDSAVKDNVSDKEFNEIIDIYYHKAMDNFRYNPEIKVKIDEILDNLKKKDKEEQEKSRRRTERLSKEEDIKEENDKKWGDFSEEELKAYLQSEEYFERVKKRFPGPSK